MESANVGTIRAAHDAFNRRDFAAAIGSMRPDATVTDHAREITFKSAEGVEAFFQEWVTAMSDAAVTERTYLDAGDRVITQFVGRGTHDGLLGPVPATGRRLTIDFCEVARFDADGRVAEIDLYYDQLSLLVQLGVVEPPLPG